MIKNKDICLPGDFLASIEEFFPGSGVYEMNGNVYASILGKIIYDLKERKVSVEPIKKPSIYLKRETTVIAKVEHVARNLAELKILYVEDTKTQTKLTAYLILKRKSSTLKDSNFLKPEDYLRARVLTTEGNIFVSIRGKNYGLIYADCPICGNPLHPLLKNKNVLVCNICNFKRRSKVSLLYIRTKS